MEEERPASTGISPRSMWPTSRSVRGRVMETMFLASLAVGNSLTVGCHFSSIGLSEVGGASAAVTQPAKMNRAMMDVRHFIVTPLFLSELALASEEIAEELGTFFGQDSGGDLDTMIQTLIFAELIERSHRAGLGVVATVNQLWDAGVDDGAGAHGAGFEGDNQSAVEETPVV